MRKITSSCISVIFLILLSVGCTSATLPAGLSEDQLKTTATSALNAFNTEDFDTLNQLFREDLQPTITTENLQSAYAQITEQAGIFEKINSKTVGSQKDNNGEEYGVVILSCKYSKATLNCIVSFDNSGNLVGFIFQ